MKCYWWCWKQEYENTKKCEGELILFCNNNNFSSFDKGKNEHVSKFFMLWRNKTSDPLKSDCRNETAGHYLNFMCQQTQELKENLKTSSGEPKQVW